MLICLFAKFFFAEFYKRLAVKLLFAICGPISRKVVPGKKNVFWQKKIYKGLASKSYLLICIYIFTNDWL
jgi:hypothetical protein